MSGLRFPPVLAWGPGPLPEQAGQVSVALLHHGEWILWLARLVGQGSRYLLLPILPALEFCIFGENEAQWQENVLDRTQETRAAVEVLSFAHHMTSGGSLFPSLAWSCLVYQVRSLGTMGMFPPAQSSLIHEFRIRAADMYPLGRA